MALTKCKECGSDVSTKADACPKCGAKRPRRTSLLAWLGALILVPSCGLGLVGMYRGSEQAAAQAASAAAVEAAKSPAQRAAESAQKAKDEADFQRAASALRSLKAGLKNPASFEVAKVIATATGALCIDYRGTNSFNAVISAVAVVTPDNKLSSGSSSDMANLWNRHCAKQPGRDMTHARRAV